MKTQSLLFKLRLFRLSDVLILMSSSRANRGFSGVALLLRFDPVISDDGRLVRAELNLNRGWAKGSLLPLLRI